MKSPRVVSVDVDWDAVRAQLADLAPLGGTDQTNADAVARLNEATRVIFPNIAVSPVPVLLPFDTGAFLRDRSAGTTGDQSQYLTGFHASTFFFYPGPAGYDAALSLQPRDNPNLDLKYVRRIDVQISGSAVIYELDSPAVEGAPVPELDGQFPGIRRLLLENHLRYTFVRFGVPYFVSIVCGDGPARARRLSCREADKVGILFLKTLNLVGGSPPSASFPVARAGEEKVVATPQTIDRPAQSSDDFTYYAAGDILPGTGMRGQSGRADATVYARIRFPMAQAPAYVNSQTFMNWGGCDFTGRVALGGRGRDAAYRCRVNSLPLVHDESKNYAYPWRDNFCEHRYFAVGQCPAGLGHQGEDIRPSSCVLRGPNADRCEPLQHDVVAVRDGVVLRSAGDEALYLVVDTPGEHIRFRYLHMNPQMLDEAGMVSGRALVEGEVIGAVDNFERHQGGTTYHLHFDVQVPTRQGWVFVNPYMTLVAAYERLIGARGRRVSDADLAIAANGVPAAPPTVDAQAAAPLVPSTVDGQAAAPAAAVAFPNAYGRAPMATVAMTTVNLAPSGSAGEGVPNSAAMASSNPPETSKPAPSMVIVATLVHNDPPAEDTRRTVREHRAKHAEHCKTHALRGHRRHDCRHDVAAARERARRAHGVRSVDRRISRQGHHARHHGGDVHPRHARRSPRHGRA